ncbi:hypothetical protein QYF61_000227 [Mycteria americana]|uniref:Uncharacterized protein n=1 Tax=Mycteria americana TaxID=33587 RepID=A0AAN7NCH1_MYCAM|nr:hypothetical protein QYF61_000227 [Mycteria americana]
MVATSAPAIGAVATPTPTTGTVATPIPMIGNTPILVSVALIHKKKSWRQKPAHLERDDKKAGPSRGEEEEEEELINMMVTTRSLSLSELRDMRKDFSCHPAVEKLSQKVQQLKEERSYSPPVQISISAIRSQCSSAQERGYRGYTPRGTLWFYLHGHGEDMRKWDGKPTSTLEEWVCELQGKTITKGVSSRKIAAPVFSGQFPRQSKRADLTSDFNEGTSDSYVEEVRNEYYEQD